MTFVDFVTPVPADWLNNVNTFVNAPQTLPYTAPYTGAKTRTINAKLAEWISVTDFTGVDKTGVTDSTVGIQAALTAAGVGGTVWFPSGTYLVSATLNGMTNQSLIAECPNSTMLQRTGNYGDTLYFANAGAAQVDGLWFNHSPFYTAGETSLPNLATSGAHIHVSQGQEVYIKNCWMWRLPYGIQFDGVTLSTIDNCWIQGVWDPVNVGCQEGIANIFLNNSVNNAEIIKIKGNYLNGAKSASRSVSYTASDGTSSITVAQNIGPQYGVLIYGCEDLLFEGNFIGAQALNSIFAPLQHGSVNLDWRFIGNFFDDGPSASNGGSHIYFSGVDNTVFVNGVSITGNVFNGETQGGHAITAFNGGAPGWSVLNNFTITGNTFQAFVGCPIALYDATTGTVCGNTVTGYNTANTSAGNDPSFCAGIGLFGQAKYIHVYGNTVGGQLNTSVPGGFTYQGISNIQTNAGLNAVHDNFMVGIGTSVNQTGLMTALPTRITTPGAYQATMGDQQVLALATQVGAWSFGLPLNPPVGRQITFKDAIGSAATFNVQVLGTVDGVTNPTYSTNYFTKTFSWNGTQWNVIAN